MKRRSEDTPRADVLGEVVESIAALLLDTAAEAVEAQREERKERAVQ